MENNYSGYALLTAPLLALVTGLIYIKCLVCFYVLTLASDFIQSDLQFFIIIKVRVTIPSMFEYTVRI